jgi:hypothetical protein
VEVPTDWSTNANLARFKPVSALGLFPTGPLSALRSVFDELATAVPPLDSIATIAKVAKHPDHLVRWCLLDCLAVESPARPEQAERWAEVDGVLRGFAHDGFPALRAYAAFLLEDRRLNLAIWQGRGTDKHAPDRARSRKAMKAHRKRPFPRLFDLVADFERGADTDVRAALDRYLAERLARLGHATDESG